MPTSASAPAWLSNWRFLLLDLMETVYTVKQMLLMYAATSMKPRMKDRVLEVYFPRQTAMTMLMAMTAAQTQRNSQLSYPNDPATCHHDNGLRNYGGGGKKMTICDLCGARWIQNTDRDKSLIQLERKEYPLHTDDIGRARSSTETARRSSTRGWASSSAGARLSPSLSLKQAKPKIIPSSVSVRLKAHNLAQQQQEMDEDASMRSWEAPEVPYMRRRPPKSYTRASTGYSASILQDDAQEMHEGPNGEMEWQARPRPVPKMQPSVVQEELEFNEDGEQVWRRTQGAIHVTMTDEELEEVDAEEEFS